MELKIWELELTEMFHLQSDLVDATQKGKRKIPPEKQPGIMVPLERKEEKIPGI